MQCIHPQTAAYSLIPMVHAPIYWRQLTSSDWKEDVMMMRIQKGAAGRSGIWIALLAMAAAAALAIWMQGERTPGAEKSTVPKLETDVASLWEWADPVLQEGS